MLKEKASLDVLEYWRLVGCRKCQMIERAEEDCRVLTGQRLNDQFN